MEKNQNVSGLTYIAKKKKKQQHIRINQKKNKK